MKRTAALLAMLMLCACSGREKLQPIPIAPQLPPPPVDTSQPVGPAMLPWVRCLIQNGPASSLCPSPFSSTSPNSTTGSEPKR